jgi:branched-chain amino acid transport system permease protein
MPQLLIGQLVPASLYALVSVGFVIVYRSTKVLDFAQGQLVLLGGFGAFTLAQFFHGNVYWTLIFAIAASLLLGALIYLLILRPLLSAGVLVLVMLTIALSIVLTSVVSLIWGVNTRFIKLNVPQHPLHLGGGITLSAVGLGTIIAAVVILGGAALVLRYTRFGAATRAAAENPLLATYRGVNVTAIAAATWGFAMATAMLAGVSFSMQTGLSASNAETLGFAAFPAVMVGGLDSMGGALVGSLLLAEIQGLGVHYVGANFSEPVGYLLLLFFLLIRPTGLFGSRDILRV